MHGFVRQEKEQSLQRIQLIDEALVPLKQERDKLNLLLDGLHSGAAGPVHGGAFPYTQ